VLTLIPLALAGDPSPALAELLETRRVEALDATVYEESPYTSPDMLPPVIEIERSYQGFNDYYYFALVDGRIFYKPRFKRPAGEPEWVTDWDWKPFGANDGLPYRLAGKKPQERDPSYRDGDRRGWIHDRAFETTPREQADHYLSAEDWAQAGVWTEPEPPSFEPDFPVPERVLAITADADEIAVLGDNRQMYYRRKFSNLFVSTEWYQGWGQAKELQVFFPEHLTGHRGWSLGRITAPGVGYKEGPDGRIFEWGPAAVSMETMVWLSEDGRIVYYLDSGTPPEVVHFVEAPFRGQYRGEAINASASTIMLLDRFGGVVTKIADFDLLGSTPTHPYCYFEECDDEVFYPPGDIRSGMSDIRLPPEDWTVHAPVLPPEAWSEHTWLSTRIGIHQTGKGNRARELRVVGSYEGTIGTFHKAFSDTHWDFREAPAGELGFADVRDDERLDPALLALHNGPAGLRALHSDEPKVDASRRGLLAVDGHTFGLTVHDFHARASPWQLTVKAGDVELPLELHVVQAWNPYMRPHAADSRDEVHSWEGTLAFDRAELERAMGAWGTSEEARALRGMLDKAKNQKFVWLVNANESGLVITPKARRRVGGAVTWVALDEEHVIQTGTAEAWTEAFWGSLDGHMGWIDEAPQACDVAAEELLARMDADVKALKRTAREARVFGRRIYLTSGLFYVLQLKTLDAALDATRKQRSDEVRPNELRFNVILGVTGRIPYLAKNIGRVEKHRHRAAKTEQAAAEALICSGGAATN